MSLPELSLPDGMVLPPQRQGMQQYVILRGVGKGGNGAVYRAKYIASNDIVAIKHITWANIRTECRRVLREILILKQMRHPHLMCCLDVFTIPTMSQTKEPSSFREGSLWADAPWTPSCLATGQPTPPHMSMDYKPREIPTTLTVPTPQKEGEKECIEAFDVCIVMPYVERTICGKDSTDYTSEDFDANEKTLVTHLYYLLRGLDYYHKSGLMHRDLSCRNVLINKSTLPEDIELYIADYGHGRDEPSNRENTAATTFYVTARNYRAPEVICSQHHYTNKVDIWAVGCIVAKALCGEEFFRLPSSCDERVRPKQRTGDGVGKQLQALLNVTGCPPEVEMQQYDKLTQQYMRDLTIQSLKPNIRNRLLNEIQARLTPETREHFISLVEACCRVGPAERPSAQQVLSSFPLFRKHNLLLPAQRGTKCHLPDLYPYSNDDVYRMVHAQCQGNRYNPFTLIATTPRALVYCEKLQGWTSQSDYKGILNEITAEIQSIDACLGVDNEADNMELGETVYELLDIHQTLDRLTNALRMDRGLVTQEPSSAEVGAILPCYGYEEEEEEEKELMQ